MPTADTNSVLSEHYRIPNLGQDVELRKMLPYTVYTTTTLILYTGMQAADGHTG